MGFLGTGGAFLGSGGASSCGRGASGKGGGTLFDGLSVTGPVGGVAVPAGADTTGGGVAMLLTVVEAVVVRF